MSRTKKSEFILKHMTTVHTRIITTTLALVMLASMQYHMDNAGAANAADIQSTPITFYHESPEEPQLMTLQSEFDFNDYISAGITELEEMTLLKDWVYSRIPYDLNYN